MKVRHTVRLGFEALEERQLLDANPLLAPLTNVALVSTATVSQQTSVERVLRWNELALQAITIARPAPPLASRNLAMVSIAMFDAANGILREYPSYLPSSVGPRTANVDAAVAVAAHHVLVKLFPNQKALFDTELKQTLAQLPRGMSRTLGQVWGSTIAARMIRARAHDGATAVVPYTSTGLPGRWEPTPPAFQQNPVLPQWPGVTPFALSSADQFQPPPPPALTSTEYTQAWDQVRQLGDVNSLTRTADQTQIARFWAAGGGTVTPPGMWNVFAQHMVRDSNLGVGAVTRLFATLNVAMADAGIACWDAKYATDYWRPVTAIREADADGNPDTTANPTWSSLIATPPFPTYTSGHSTFSAAGAEVLSAFFGANTAFRGTSDSLPGVQRSWTSFRDAAEEASLSRVYGGIHFLFDCTEGLASGAQIGATALARFGMQAAA